MSKAKAPNLLKKIYHRGLHLAVVGLGYVGLPTAALFADTGFHVTAIDIDPEVVEAVNKGINPINEPELDVIISHNVQIGRLKATSNPKALTQMDAIIVSVQTPIDQHRKPNLHFLMKAIEDVGKTLEKGILVVIASTVPPGTLFETIKPKLEALSGLRAEEDFYLAYAPERIAPGRAIREFVENPRLVGGIGLNSTKITAELFKTVCKEVIETDALTAEIAKLAENTYRDINIAFANQLALICEQYGADVKKVIELANTHPRVNIHAPGPGVGGPCLPKDPYLLISKAKLEENMIEMARRINDYMPKHIVEVTIQAIESVGKKVSKCKIAVLGIAYKADVGDSRLSPSKTIIQQLQGLGAKVAAYDPYCHELFGAEKAENLHEAIKNADCIIIATDHTEFKKMNLSKLKEYMKENPIIVDGKRIITPNEAKNVGFKYYGIGYGVKNEI